MGDFSVIEQGPFSIIVDTGLPLTSTPGVTIDACTQNVPSDACAEVTTVSIDIKPGSSPNTINPKSKGVFPVAILTTKTFDATTVDPPSVRFGPKGAREVHDKAHIQDVNKDGEPDLVLHFQTQATGHSMRGYLRLPDGRDV